MSCNGFRARSEKFFFKTLHYLVPVYCCNCDIGQKKGHTTKTHKLYYTILPDTLIPYKQYSASIIEEYICSEDKEAQEDMSVLTPKHWREEFEQKSSNMDLLLALIVINTHLVKKDILSSLKYEIKHSKVDECGQLLSEIWYIYNFTQQFAFQQVLFVKDDL
jgi:hypothetical protein